MRRSIVQTIVLFGIVPLFFVGNMASGQALRQEYANPIGGLSLHMPEDWEMASLVKGWIAISLDAGGGALLAGQPVLYFNTMKEKPEKAAPEIARTLELLGKGSKALIRQTGTGEWEIRMASDGVRGPLVERWVSRTQGDRHYVLGAMARPGLASRAQSEIDAAIRTCRLIPQPIYQRFREPTEHAYHLNLPQGWKWEGKIMRTLEVPGYFVWKAYQEDGLAGCFSSPPGSFNVMTPYASAKEAAQTHVLNSLEQQIPGIRLEKVHPLPRPGAHFREVIRNAGLGANPQIDKVFADYIGKVKDVPVRLRIQIMTVMFDTSPILGGRGNWILFSSGAWAPLDRFDQVYPLGRGVLTSLVTSEAWKKGQAAAVDEVMANRRETNDRINVKWGGLALGCDRVKDEKTGKFYEDVPRVGGNFYVDDTTGTGWWVPEGNKPDPHWRRVEHW